MLPILYNYGAWALLLLRLVVGSIFIVHGWPKLKNWSQTTQWFDSVGFKPGVFWGTLVGVLESFGSIALILGLFVQPLAILFAGQMAVATLWKIKNGQKLKDGYELDLLLVAATLALATLGGGAYAMG